MSSSELALYNTEKRKKELFKPLEAGCVKMYTCGPTVYDVAHIGNFRTYLFEDILRRALKFFGMAVTHVMNITDVDDKTIRAAVAKGVSLQEYTEPYIRSFFEDLDALNIERAEHYPKATDYISQMIEMIETLMDKGLAYKSDDGSVYFAIRRFPRYGCLSHLDMDELLEGGSMRVHSDEYDKENASDFVLWKTYDAERDGGVYWESPFGPGRPGWHLECSAMATSLLGDTFDIHCGGVDNIFPHHENEIAQSEGCTGKRFVNYWMHSEHLVVNNKKMSKSLGNFFTLRDLLSKGYDGLVVRYALFQSHYKSQLNFTIDGLDAARASLERLQDFIHRLQTVRNDVTTEHLFPLIAKAKKEFSQGLADDLNTPEALAALFDFVKEVNILCDEGKVSTTEAKAALGMLQEINSVLGFLAFKEDENEGVPQDVIDAVAAREQARKTKNWAEADELRNFVLKKGYLIEDSPKGARIKKL
ncbi:cysteine--tRNA ligase [Simkania negevensis]|uniref:Cysteine--tRNA ligase n=1 Tax=Simkania negevensis TaxID=83561 RepID=A0ABS3AQV9_9BACT|nr:cysteine--tRNA ligase [Simkania negevensis]